MREALGNSLNIPSVKALQQVGAEAVLDRLRKAGITGLDRHPHIYGDGLALGNGEINLFSLVQGYAVLANRGQFQGLHVHPVEDSTPATDRVFMPRITSLISDILSDRDARALEFGQGGVLDLPVQTAVKTGTSSDHRDAWAVGFDSRYVVGVWLGNLDGAPMRDVSGATGPARVMRSLFAFLNRDGAGKALYLSPELIQAKACVRWGQAGQCTHQRDEWFTPGTVPLATAQPSEPTPPRVRRPTPGLRLAIDPRIPLELQRFRFALERHPATTRVEWYVDGEPLRSEPHEHHDVHWPLTPGKHAVSAKVWRAGLDTAINTRPVEFLVR